MGLNPPRVGYLAENSHPECELGSQRMELVSWVSDGFLRLQDGNLSLSEVKGTYFSAHSIPYSHL